MTNQQILEKAIQKAIDGGWDGHWYGVLKTEDTMPSETEYCQLIFNHKFAKALWGDGVRYPYDYKAVKGIKHEISFDYGWEYHLQQMVIAKDPIKYLGDNL